MENKKDTGLESAQNWTDVEKKIVERILEREEGLARDVTEQAKRNAKRWFVAWLITLIVLAATNAAWIYVFQSYDYVSQDGEGYNYYNSDVGGNVNNGTYGYLLSHSIK